MTSLLDIGPLTEEVKIGTKVITVRGMTPEGFFYLLSKFPEVLNLFGGKADMASLQTAAPQSIAHVLAIATTDRTEFASASDWQSAVEKAAAVAVNLSAYHQAALLQAALRLTFPEGVGPFTAAMETLAGSISRASGRAQATTSSKRSRSGLSTDSRGMRLGRAAPRASSTH